MSERKRFVNKVKRRRVTHSQLSPHWNGSWKRLSIPRVLDVLNSTRGKVYRFTHDYPVGEVTVHQSDDQREQPRWEVGFSMSLCGRRWLNAAQRVQPTI